jgi:hypothetical protein
MRILRFAFELFLVAIFAQNGQCSIDAVAAAKAHAIDAVWHYHLAVVNAVIIAKDKNLPIHLTEFGHSVDLIESLTGISSNTGTRAGRLPSPQLATALHLWERWYEHNRQRLDIAPGGCLLRLKR